jgi:hypothetical protein
MIVAIRDKQIASIQNQIENRRKLLLHNNKKLRVITDENEYLKEIADDYDKYFNYIKEKKEQQIKAFDLIYKYLERIIKSNKYTEEELINATREQKEILDKINAIKTELDDIISENKNEND